MAGPNPSANADLFDSYFRRADLDGDGRISGAEAVGFFQGANLPKPVLAQIWMYADLNKVGYLGRAEFYNALKLVTVAQSKRQLTPEIVKAALNSPASAKIPAPQINLATAPSPQMNPRTPIPIQGSVSQSPQPAGPRAPHVAVSASNNHQYFPSQLNQTMRPSQATPTAHISHPQQVVGSQGMLGTVNMTPTPTRPPSSNASADWLQGRMGNQMMGVNSQVSHPGTSPPASQNGFGLTESVLTSSVQPRQTAAEQIPYSAQTSKDSSQSADKNSKALVVSGNGFSSDSLFGDVFSTTQSQPSQDGLSKTATASSVDVSSAVVPAPAVPQPAQKPNPLDAFYNRSTPQHVGVQSQQGQASFPQPVDVKSQQGQARFPQSVGVQSQQDTKGKQGQQFLPQSNTASASSGFPAGAGNSASSQSEPPWPKMTQSAVQKYTKVFMEVDKDRDGRITGLEARNLFLSWRLPREILKQVWDLSDQDNDSMLSLREFCVALYLMERYREGCPLPAVLPRSVMLDETMLSITGQPTAPHGHATWGHTPGMQPTQNTSGVRPNVPAAAARPPRPRTVPQADNSLQPAPLKPRVPELEKPLLNQLSNEEQDSLNTKFQEATIADKKVEELEKEIIQCREKIDFYRTKMQEIILYKSRCDNRLNEIIERVSADKHEAESLAKKYEQKCMQVGDVASKLTSEEATFRDIQEKKMELYQEIVKLERNITDEDRQARAEKIQSGLDKLVKSVNERCKKYGLRAKPSSLVEIPFGWQPGIQEASADWDENWDKFEEDEGFTLVKELTLDVQNVVAPPKPKFSTVKREVTSGDDDLAASNNVAKSENVSETGEQIRENEFSHDESKNGPTRSPDSRASKATEERPSPKFQESQTRDSIGPDGSPHATHDGSPHGYDTHSDHGGLEPVPSGDKRFEEAGWGRFDIHYDTDSVWGSDSFSATETDHGRRGDDSIFGTTGDFGLKPIKTESSYNDNMFPQKNSSLFADSVPSTPANNFGASPEKFSSELRGNSPFAFPDSVPSTPAYNFGSSTQKFGDDLGGKSLSVFVDSVPSTPANHFGSSTHNSSLFADSVPSTPAYNYRSSTQNSSVFADSVPSTPAYNFDSSAQRFGGPEEHSFNNFSRFDSFNAQSPRNSLSRFDSSRDFDTSHGYSSSPRSLARFDSVRSSADFDPAHGFSSSPRSSYARFDSVRGSADFDSNNGFSSSSPRDSFARFDSFRSSKDFDVGHGFSSSFDDSDPFGSGPFRTSAESQSSKKGSDSWSAF